MFALRTAAQLWRCPNRNLTGLASCRYRKYHQQQVSPDHSRFLKVSEEVQDALNLGKPVVALETTIYTHGKFCSRVLFCSVELTNATRLPISSKHSPCVAARISCPSQWRSSGDGWYFQRHRACWNVSRRAHRAGTFRREQICTQGFSQRSQLYMWTGNINNSLQTILFS